MPFFPELDKLLHAMTGGWRPYALLLVLCLATFLPGLASIPPIDRDESRFAQASRQMLESGDYIRIEFQDESRAKKPVGIYWMQAASAHLLDAEQAIWAYRIPSVLGGLCAVLLTFAFGQGLVGRPAAMIGAALLACSFMLVAEAHQAKTDAVLLAAVVAAQGALGRFYMAGNKAGPRPGQITVLAFWLAQGVGILIKGPMVPVISLLTLAALWIADRRIGWLRGIRPLAGLVIVAAMVGPWAIAVSSATQGQFIGQAVKSDLLPKLLGAQESHGAPPGYYLLLALATFWPASLFAVPGLVRAIRSRRAAALRFCLAWIVPAWIMFEIVPTKLPHYVLPTYPALALLAGIAITADADELRAVWAKALYALWSLVGVGLAVLFVLAPARLGNGYSLMSVPAALAALAGGLAPAWLAWRDKAKAATVVAIAGAILTYGFALQGLLPQLDQMWLSRQVADAVRQMAPVAPEGLAAQSVPVAATGFHEPSLVFLLGTQTRLTSPQGAAEFLLTEKEGAVAVVEAADEAEFHAVLDRAGAKVQALTRVDGFNYSRGRPARLTLWTREMEH